MAEQKGYSEVRPSPEALLEAARREEGRTGKLRIFVGAAPGVGKTYEMLQTARARKKDGYDVVVGIVETHGRKETKALLEGLEIVPRRQVEYKGRSLEEMDLDAIIARRPQIVLVDELAHTNAPGSRHPKRYLDVEELLDHGIDVYTTVNIQHIESLNDVVAQITRVRVRETVPDSVFDRADAVELVDLTPGDLIERLKEGKVYIPEQAERALEHFFSPANLTALRELALRRTAERVDEQLLTEMQSRAISGPWAACERLLVCVSEDPRSAGLVRYAKRVADRLHAQWTALSVETRRSLRLSEEERDRIADTLRLAERLGGEFDHRAERSTACRRRHPGICPRQQRNADHRRQVGEIEMVRDPARLHRARSSAALRQYQRAGHRGRRAWQRADPEEVRPRRARAAVASTRSLISRLCSPSERHSASRGSSGPGSGSRASISYS